MEIYPSLVGGGLLPRCDRYAFSASHLCGPFPARNAHPINWVRLGARIRKPSLPSGLRPPRGDKGIPNLPRFACADLRCARPPLCSGWGDPSLAPCYPRLRQVAFGMYMPRFNAEVQKPNPRSKHHEHH
jgi:hypothetical protein